MSHSVRKTIKKWVASAALVATVLVQALVSVPMAFAAPTPPSLYFSPNSGTYYVGEEFDVNVMLNTGGQATDAADAFFFFDYDEMDFQSLTTGSIYQAYPGQLVNTSTGYAQLTGFSILNPFIGTGSFATLRFRAAVPTNDARMTYQFTPGSTVDSNIAKTVTSEDILNEIENASFVFIPDTNPPYTLNWNPSKGAVGVGRNSNVTFRIRDNERGVDINTVKVTVDGIEYTRNGANKFTFSGDKMNYLVVVNPSGSFDYSETVNVRIEGADFDANYMAPDIYSFTIADEPVAPNQPPDIVDIDASVADTVFVRAEDPDGPETDLTLTVSGVAASIPFTDNGDGTGVLDYTDLTEGNYYVCFTATDAGSPQLSDTDCTWLTIGPVPPPPPPPAPPRNRPPVLQPMLPIEATVGETVVVELRATDPDDDAIRFSVQADAMNLSSILDNGNGTGSFSWTPDSGGIYYAVVTATDDGDPNLSDTKVATIFVTGDTVCPEVEGDPVTQQVFVCPEEEVAIEDVLAEKVPDEIAVTRGEVVEFVLDKLKLRELQADQLEQCNDDPENCLSIFALNSQYQQKSIQKEQLRLYPDIETDCADEEAINSATMLNIVTGYYGDKESPFKPCRVITRIEALKVLLGSVGLVDWVYESELKAQLGGEEGLRSQPSPFEDIDSAKPGMWWYARYANVAVRTGIIPEGKFFRPDDFVTEAELDGMAVRLDEFLANSGYQEFLKQDSDNDKIPDYKEQDVHLTDHKDSDTDDDGLDDHEEIFVLKTNPFDADTDHDGLNDFDELNSYKTDPLMIDTDGDTFSDAQEIREGFSPIDSLDYPKDLDGNGIGDEWEKKYGLEGIGVKASTNDGDNDGLSDKLEYWYGTSPLDADSDGDGYTDGEEILNYRTDPLTTTLQSDIVVRVTNIQEGQVISDRTPLFKGVAPAGIPVMMMLRNDFGHERVLGEIQAEENNIFVYEVPFDLQNGSYSIVFKVLDEKRKDVRVSPPLKFTVNPDIVVTRPDLKTFDEKPLTEEVLLSDLKVEVINDRPVLTGTTSSGNQVIATWKSIVMTSALLADTTAGDFSIQAPRPLPVGDHEVYVYAVRTKDNVVSDTIRVPFTVTDAIYRQAAKEKDGSNILKEGETVITEDGRALFNVSKYWWALGLLFLFAMVALFVWYRMENDEESSKKKK